MLLSLSSHNVIQYLQDAGLCSSEDGAAFAQKLPKNSNNFNFLVSISAKNHKLLVKQEGNGKNNEIPQEFFNEWLFKQLLDSFPVLANISAITSLVLHFDQNNSILVRQYLQEYVELASFYQQNEAFPEAIATAVGNSLATLHRTTFNCREYREFMSTAPQGQFRYQFYNPAQGIGSIGPEIFGQIPGDGLKFYALYQRYESLEAAIAQLAYEWHPCCLTHNDLKLENILVHSRWERLDNCLVRLIDWEAASWGDPAFDLGTLLASYLGMWLDSLVVDYTIELEESLNLALIPLEVVQPSILALMSAYLDTFGMILNYRRDFILRVVQFAGLGLIYQLQDKINRHKYFENLGTYIFEFAKTLLIMPQESVIKIFGISELELIQSVAKLEKIPQQQQEQNLLRIYYPKTRLRGC
ncbi:MAG: aminoglycoside phosphotransferase family protein [Nostocaceae cyanobacterium]|nr:aminoglycoside phosphotransferase family protein [Nostocaceae cyanobacterium]